MNLTEMRVRLRHDLGDEDPQGQRWNDDELDRHIAHAVRELSLAVPLEAKAQLQASGGRELSIASLEDVVAIGAAEYPVGNYPPTYVRFSLWGQSLTIHSPREPEQGEEVRVYYGQVHTLDETSSTIPRHLEELVAIGAAGYAALEWASFAVNRVNVGGSDTWKGYLEWGQDRLAAFMKGLSRHSQKNRVRSQRLYRPYEPPDEPQDWRAAP